MGQLGDKEMEGEEGGQGEGTRGIQEMEQGGLRLEMIEREAKH